jgi:hypothetical protein
VQACASQFRYDKWEDQPYHVEVMAEKDAVTGILAPVCRELQVRFTANRGYASSSLFYEISQRLLNKINEGKEVMILYLGDHDPSGIDMTRDITERMAMFTETEVEVRRLALNMDQVKRWNPPENPAKETDSRFSAYLDQYGDKSWELDAIEPRTLANIVRDEIFSVRDIDLWQDAVGREEEARNQLLEISKRME